jgi:AmiR/NasT family two-component response regulator
MRRSWPACWAAVAAHAKGRLAEQLQAALEHRGLIERAKGILMARDDIDAATAFERLRSAARSSRRPLTDVVRDVIAGKPLSNRRDNLT